jgi:hypothetical protein
MNVLHSRGNPKLVQLNSVMVFLRWLWIGNLNNIRVEEKPRSPKLAGRPVLGTLFSDFPDTKLIYFNKIIILKAKRQCFTCA